MNCNAGSYSTGSYATNVANTNTGNIYYGNPVWCDNPYYWQESPPVTVITKIVEVPAPEPQKDRKENDMAISRQTFLDALGDEGKSVDSESRGVIKEASAEKWELFIARLLARAFKDADLVMLKEKPKEVLIKEA